VESDSRLIIVNFMEEFMKEVKIPKEIKDYKEKIFLNLSIRQALSFTLGMFVVVPFFVYSVYKLKWDADLVGWLAIIIGIPLFSIGFFTYKGMSMEKFIFQLIKTSFIYPVKRYYRKRNILEEYLDELNKEKVKSKKRKKISS
jgi:hypothetical protein